ncbi:hypothetical protein [Flavobacterium haoranii]|uniref:Protein refolding chaperone Spy/CpxP family n=1 Tax=Flavobacterium haoranii TaxID=683124 RepID=A0A1M6FEX7_9FLAO|nr:hypothetical protein [Flavobacterium haoranii]SHI96196.1 hypothetical protein SAMN05444337_1211 [Flavobacterium haoranii]
MKKIAILFLIISNLTVFAQQRMPPKGERPDGPPKGEKPKKEKISIDDQVKIMTSDLNLDELQQLQVREILIDQEKNRPSFSKENTTAEPSQDEMEAKMKEEKNTLDAKFKKILTEEQYTKFTTKMEERNNKKKRKNKEQEE